LSLSTATRWQRQSILMMIVGITCRITVVCATLIIWHTISSISSILRCLYHRWQLQFLIVWIIAFFSVVSFSIAHHFLIQVHTTLVRRWPWRDATRSSWVWCGVLDARIEGRICAGHQIDVVEAASDHVSGVRWLVVTEIELVEVVWAVDDWVACVVAGGVLVWLEWMEVVVSTTSTVELAVTVTSFCSVLSKLISWTCHSTSSYVVMMSTQRNLWCSWIGTSMCVAGVRTMRTSKLVIQRWCGRWTPQRFAMMWSMWHSAQIKTMMSATASSTVHFISEMCCLPGIIRLCHLLRLHLVGRAVLLLVLKLLILLWTHAPIGKWHQNWVWLWWHRVIAILVLHTHNYWISCS